MTWEANVLFRVQVYEEVGSIRIAYEIANQTDSELGLLNRIFSHLPDGSIDFSSSNAYIDVTDSCLRIHKGILPVPKGLQVSERVIPGITRLPAGSRFQEKMQFNVPIKVFNPHRMALLMLKTPDAVDVVAQASRSIAAIEVSVGVFAIPSNARLTVFSPNQQDIWRIFPPGAAAEGQVIFSHRTALQQNIEVLDYEVLRRPPV